MSDTLYTLTKRNRHQMVIKKSRFLALAAPVASIDAIWDFLQEVSAPEATHNCWAYRLGQEYRFNDDGEPSGSAGKPILAAIDGQHLDGVMVVVTRWFGGTKLGVGGLIRAYGGTAAECLRQAPQHPIIHKTSLQLECDYSALGLIKARLEAMDADIHSEDFGAHGVVMQLALPNAQLPTLQTLLADATHGQGRLHWLEDESPPSE